MRGYPSTGPRRNNLGHAIQILHTHRLANDRLRHMLIGYARVSKADGSQSLDLQRDALQVEGVAAKSTVVMGEVSSLTHE